MRDAVLFVKELYEKTSGCKFDQDYFIDLLYLHGGVDWEDLPRQVAIGLWNGNFDENKSQEISWAFDEIKYYYMVAEENWDNETLCCAIFVMIILKELVRRGNNTWLDIYDAIFLTYSKVYSLISIEDSMKVLFYCLDAESFSMEVQKWIKMEEKIGKK